MKYILRKRTTGFVVISASVVHALKKKLEILGFYTYLLSLPDNWDFYKTYLMKECGIGRNKLNKYLRELQNLGLINYGQERNGHGQFSHIYMDIYDVEHLNGQKNVNEINDVQPLTQNHRYGENGLPVLGGYIKEPLHKKKKTKNSCPSDDGRSFDQFWKVWPRKQKKKRAQEAWNKLKLNNKVDIIIEDVKKRIAHDVQWQNPQFIPHPTTYLNDEPWMTDEIIKDTKPTKVSNIYASLPEWSATDKNEIPRADKETALKALNSIKSKFTH